LFSLQGVSFPPIPEEGRGEEVKSWQQRFGGERASVPVVSVAEEAYLCFRGLKQQDAVRVADRGTAGPRHWRQAEELPLFLARLFTEHGLDDLRHLLTCRQRRSRSKISQIMAATI
jgi:hypothetical protein